MSDDSSAAIAAARKDWKSDHLDRYLDSGGADGHIEDLRAVGGHRFSTNCMIRYTGRKSGRTIVTPLVYGDIGGEVVICASKGGADHHPAWYLNLKETPELACQIGTQAFTCTWREPEGAEREKVWAFIQDVFPPYTAYQASTDRLLPLILLTPVEPVPVFTRPD